ncbi:hypothetical protein ABPG75_003186 [Micractinium tetrahymenae]
MGRPLRCSEALPGALLALLLLTAVVVVGSSSPEDDAAIMRRLREALAAADPAWSAPWHGWQPNDTTHPCAWQHVECRRQRVVSIRLFTAKGGDAVMFGASKAAPSPKATPPAAAAPATPAAAPGPPPWGALIPELAQLEHLEELEMRRMEAPGLGAALPPEWGRAGAFRSLRTLSLEKLLLQGPLPDVEPGALPALESLYLNGEGAAVPLPPSWGASPLTLPSLDTLSLHAPLEGPLPTEWAQGFRQLAHLVLSGGSAAAARPPPAGPRPTLPPEWAELSAFPRLRLLSVTHPQLAGTFPPSWEQGGFPSLESLSFSFCNLTGPLPERIFEQHPDLTYISFEGTQVTSTLPAAWSASEVQTVVLSYNPLLTGPAFPPAWSQPRAFSQLDTLSLVDCAGLTGTLPAEVPWPLVHNLELEGTGLQGSVPASWCAQPLASTLRRLSVTHTRVDPALPACFATALANAVFLTNDTSVSMAATVAAQAAQAARLPAGLLALAVLLPLTAVVVGAVAAHVVRQRRRRRRQAAGPGEEEWRDVECLLVHMQRQQEQRQRHGLPAKRGGSGGSGRGSAASGAPSSVLELPGSSRRARLEAQLSAQVATSGGSGQGGRVGAVEMLPLEALPTALAHQLGSLRRAAAATLAGGGGGAARASGHASSVQAHCHTLGGSTAVGTGSGSGLLDACKAADVDAWAAGALAASPPPSEPGSSPPLSRQWGMATDSLRLSAGELQLLVGPDGRFVELGAGSYAVVYCGRLKGRPVAVKMFELEAGMDSGVVWREVSLLRSCTHPRIVPLLGVALKGHLVLLAMELMGGGSLRAALQQPEWQSRLRWADRGWRVALDVAEALHFLHSQHVIHSDLKAANVLLSGDGRACVSDLGLAQVLVGPATAVGCSRIYAAPEQLLGQRCTLAADMYSFGILLIELLTQKHWDLRGQWRLPRAPEECPAGVVSLIEGCIHSDPSRRPSAEQALACLRAEAPAEAASSSGSTSRLFDPRAEPF